MTPSEVNLTDDGILAERVLAVATNPAGPLSSCEGLVPYATYDLVYRVHEHVARLNNAGRLSWSKQATVGRTLALVTGVAANLSVKEWEYVGNLVDARLKHYCKNMAKALEADRKRAQRARKRGADNCLLPSRITELKERLYVCEYGGTPLKVPIYDQERLPSTTTRRPTALSINRQRVPYHACSVGEVLSEFQRMRESQRAQASEQNSTLLSLEREARQTIRDAELAQERCKKSEERAAAAAAILQVAANEAQTLAAESRRQTAESERVLKEHESKTLCLEGHLNRAFREVESEARKRQRLEEVNAAALASLRAEIDTARSEAEECKKRMKEAKNTCQKQEAEVLLMEGKLVRMWQHAYQKEREHERASEQADAVVDAVRADLEAMKQALEACKQQKRLVERECHVKDGEVLRLQNKLGHSMQDVARATVKTDKIRETFEKKQERLLANMDSLQIQLNRARELKNQMARRVREVRSKEAVSAQQSQELHKCRQRVRYLRREMGTLKAQLCVHEDDVHDAAVSSGDDSESSAESENLDICKESTLSMETAAAQASDAAEALRKLQSMPTWCASRGQGRGRGAPKIEWGVRLVIYSLLSLMVPPSAVGMIIVLIVKHTAPWLKPQAPTVETVHRCRFELRFLEEALAARRVASAYRVRSIGFDETTKLGNSSLTSNVQIEPTEGAKFQDVILRAAYCPMGGTSQLCVESIEKKCFSRLRDFLRRWRDKFKEMFPGEEWTGPDPALCSLHRLGGGGALISDTCNTARLAKQLLAKLIAEQVKDSLGQESWDSMSESEREAAVRTHPVDCWQHLRNIFLAEMSRAQAAHVAAELQPELDTFSAWERMSTDFAQLLRAAFKEFHHGCRYYKGQGRSFTVWLRETFPEAFSLHLERADGGRQDLDYDAAIPLYVDRKFFVEYLHGRVFAKDHRNILEDFLYVVFRSLQYVAMTRANAIIDLHISRPMRWLSGKASQLTAWSPSSMGEVLDIVEQFFERAQHDGSLFLDPDLDLFKPIADRQPLFAAWRTQLDNDVVLSPDGSQRHSIWKEVKAEVLQPSDATNASTRMKTIEYLEVQCRAGLRKLHDPKLALRDKLTSVSGDNCVGNSEAAHADTIGVHATNDALAEGVFGTYDMILRRFQGISMEAASAVAQAVRSQMLSLGDGVARRKQSTVKVREAFTGYIYSLPPHEQEALVEVARVTVKEMRDIDRLDHAALDEYHKQRRKVNEEDALNALFTRYALALSFFERWVKRGAVNSAQVATNLNGFGGEGEMEQEKLNWLREQIEMRVIGLSWTDWATPWHSSKDEYVGTVGQLKAHLHDVLKEEHSLRQRGELPSVERALEGEDQLAAECPAPQFQRKTFKSLGTPTVQATQLAKDHIDLSPEDVLSAAIQRRKELEEKGEIDWVSDRQPFPTGQGPTPDKSLIGKKLELRWRYRHLETGAPVYIWCEGEVVKVADGEHDKASARCRKILPAGAVQIRWAADVEYDEQETYVWSILKPSGFNKDVHLGWRFSADELKRMQSAQQKPARSFLQHGKREGASEASISRNRKKN